MTLLPPGAHGGDAARFAARLGVPVAAILDLSVSLNPLAPDVGDLVASHLDALGRYPDPAPATRSLAAIMGVDPDLLMLTNGGAEAIALVAAELGAGWVEPPEFSLYERHFDGLEPAGARWRSNPRNPTGELAPPHAHAEVWDEAFWPLATGTWSRGDHASGSVVLGSLTKLLACPGLRAGYVLCPEVALRQRLAARQPRWSVNGLVAEGLADMLATVDLPAWSAGIGVLRSRLAELLTRRGLVVRPSAANWLLVDAPHLRDALLEQRIVVRDCASFGLPGTVRIAVPGAAGLDRLDQALAAITSRAEGAP